MTEEQKQANISQMANADIKRAIAEEMGKGLAFIPAFIHVLENAELIRGFTKNDKLKCRHIGIVIGYFVKTNRKVSLLVKDRNKEFIQNGYAYIRSQHYA